MGDLSPEERADAIVDNLDIYQRSTTMTPKAMIAAHIREAVHSLEFEVARLLRVDAERAKEVEQLQRRLAERRQAFRDVEHRAKTLAGARKAIQAIGHKLMVARGALRKIVEANEVDGYVLDAGAARRVAADALEQLGRKGINPSSDPPHKP